MKEHLKAPSPIYDYHATTGYLTIMDNFSIVDREWHGFARAIRESIYSRINKPTLNRNIGKYNLPHILDGVLVNMPELIIIKHL